VLTYVDIHRYFSYFVGWDHGGRDKLGPGTDCA
jgi:hypothetical protein